MPRTLDLEGKSKDEVHGQFASRKRGPLPSPRRTRDANAAGITRGFGKTSKTVVEVTGITLEFGMTFVEEAGKAREFGKTVV